MAPVRVASQSIVRYSSQDAIHRAGNLLIGNKTWLSHKDDQSGRIEVEIHLSKATKIAFVNIGNAGSAFIELIVGSSMWPSGKEYVPFLPSTVLMSPQDSKTGHNSQSIKMLNKDSFRKNVSDQEWDRIQVICRQPFNKDKQFGLQFIDFIPDDKVPTTNKLETKQSQSPKQTLAQFKSMLSPTSKRPPSLNHSPSGSRLSTPSPPSRAAGLVQAALKGRGKPTPILKETTPTRRRNSSSSLKTSPYSVTGSASMQRGKTFSRSCAGDIEDEIECFLEGFKFDEMPVSMLEQVTYRDLKDKIEQQRGCPLSKEERKIFLKLAKKSVGSVAAKHNDNVEEKTPSVEVIDLSGYELSGQDLCGQDLCAQVRSWPTAKPNNIKAEETSNQPSDKIVVEDCGEFVICPICYKTFPQSRISVHANVCAEMNFEMKDFCDAVF